MDKDQLRIYGLILLLVIFIISMIIMIRHTDYEYDLACKEIGLESYWYEGNLQYCEDDWGNLYYAKVECEPWYWIECEARLISIGDVRMVK